MFDNGAAGGCHAFAALPRKHVRDFSSMLTPLSRREHGTPLHRIQIRCKDTKKTEGTLI
jgi:hypothetical protein